MDRSELSEGSRQLRAILWAIIQNRTPPSALPSDATRRPIARMTTTRTRSRGSSPSARPSPPPASATATAGLPAPELEGLLAPAMNVDVHQDQPPEAGRSQEQDPEFQFVMAPPPIMDRDEGFGGSETLMWALMNRIPPSALRSAATRRPIARAMTTQTRSRRFSTLARPSPQPASATATATAGIPAPRLEGLLAAAMDLDVHQDQPPEAGRSEEQDPEFQFVMAPPPSVDHIRDGVPSPAGGIVPPTGPPAPVDRETASTRPRVVKFRSAYWVWIVLSRRPVDPLPAPSDRDDTSARVGSDEGDTSTPVGADEGLTS